MTIRHHSFSYCTGSMVANTVLYIIVPSSGCKTPREWKKDANADKNADGSCRKYLSTHLLLMHLGISKINFRKGTINYTKELVALKARVSAFLFTPPHPPPLFLSISMSHWTC